MASSGESSGKILGSALGLFNKALLGNAAEQMKKGLDAIGRHSLENAQQHFDLAKSSANAEFFTPDLPKLSAQDNDRLTLLRRACYQVDEHGTLVRKPKVDQTLFKELRALQKRGI